MQLEALLELAAQLGATYSVKNGEWTAPVKLTQERANDLISNTKNKEVQLWVKIR